MGDYLDDSLLSFDEADQEEMAPEQEKEIIEDKINENDI